MIEGVTIKKREDRIRQGTEKSQKKHDDRLPPIGTDERHDVMNPKQAGTVRPVCILLPCLLSFLVCFLLPCLLSFLVRFLLYFLLRIPHAFTPFLFYF